MMRKLLHTPVFSQMSPSLILIWTQLLCQATLLITSDVKSSFWILAHIYLSLFSQECLFHSFFIKLCPWLLQNITHITRSQRRNYKCRRFWLHQSCTHHLSISGHIQRVFILFYDCACNYKDYTTTHAGIWVRLSL